MRKGTPAASAAAQSTGPAQSTGTAATTGTTVSSTGSGSKAGKGRIRAEVWIILGLSLGQSAVYAVVQLLDKLSRAPLAQGTSTLNVPQSNRGYFDLTYQLLGIGFALVPVALVLYLLWQPGRSAFERLGFTLKRPGRDVLWGLALFVAMGLPSLGLYAVGRALGITTEIIPSALNAYWWTIPVLVISAVRHAVVEEVIVVGYLLDRFGKFGWSTAASILTSSLLRGSYHLYQGFGPFLGNFVMGLVFCWFYRRYGRVMPLVIAHALLDSAAFVAGPALGLG
ncbi:CPBP family intramembrane metalloprotease [Paenarthrobacter sp. Z7-10]|uniref:CPBP family intramembrane glutamic endopeptidase n=1 Tax=Paenarthrobacter sp. Z7-10 TaxID=2787635 RepID=UPI0022A930A4|nr:CPBP family intramembrane glutamic endopeptidase [Paenarthrobacter sp. Z7-10]MCZ2402874.1 CPBP family intramembrane metalloprotease [Paenarthrobacter sp. Z7-10]